MLPPMLPPLLLALRLPVPPLTLQLLLLLPPLEGLNSGVDASCLTRCGLLIENVPARAADDFLSLMKHHKLV